MNIYEKDILNYLYNKGYSNQRTISKGTCYSLGSVNQALSNLENKGFLSPKKALTSTALEYLSAHTPESAIILAAGYGMRTAPINTETPKGLIEVRGELLIERIIRQLHEVKINDIYVVVGYMKERYEYLIDEFGVNLIVNTEYKSKNNIHSLKKALPHLPGSYIIPCDIWCLDNPFSKNELYSWYMVSDAMSPGSYLHINRKKELIPGSSGSNDMLGIAYITAEDAASLAAEIMRLCSDPEFDNSFWESALFRCPFKTAAKLVKSDEIVEINTYEQLRELDESSSHLKTNAIQIICQVLKAEPSEIINVESLKKGMTNRSFTFEYRGKKYIMRIPGEGTSKLINRKNEAAVYDLILPHGICDNVLYINPDNGYKITEFVENARVCDPANASDVRKCMKTLRTFHNQGLKTEHEFNIWAQIEYYESLWDGKKSIYRDYEKTKAHVLSLRPFIEKLKTAKSLTHIDAVPDNFLFYKKNGTEKVLMIDWEYAGMADPHTDIAMFAIYSYYDKAQIDRLIDFYFQESCDTETRTKIYCYVALCGLLWSNWCEYKLSLGVEFGDYSLKQYRYAKDFYAIAMSEIEKL